MSLQEELQGPPPAKLVVDHVSKWFQQKRQNVHALDDVSFDVAEGEFQAVAENRRYSTSSRAWKNRTKVRSWQTTNRCSIPDGIAW